VSEVAVEPFALLQKRLPDVWRLNHHDSTTAHVIVVVPAFSLGETILSHYATRLGAMEHRYLLATTMLGRIPGCEVVFVTCEEPDREVLAYYDRLASPGRPGSLLDRLHVVTVDDRSPRAVSAKLLEQPDLLERVRRLVGDRPAMLEPWNVTDTEVALAEALGVPIYGTDPSLWPLGFKSAGRALFRDVGVPTPAGCEDVTDLAGVAEAVRRIRRLRPHVAGVVVKHDNSGAGDGNLVVSVLDQQHHRIPCDELVQGLGETVAPWYLHDLRASAVVEELVRGRGLRSPSAQLEITPDGVRLLSTHEQVLGGDNGQVYSGCSFPADPEYAEQLCRYSARVAARLGEAGALGRLGVDFVAVRRGRSWQVFALEVNLRKGGTTHPFAALRHLAPGHYDAATGEYRLTDGTSRGYRSTDGLLDPAWRVLTPAQVIDAVAAAGLEFDPVSRVGAVLHMLSCLKVDGRLGVTAIGRTATEVEEVYSGVTGVVAGLA
jgi:hypothetical protein